MEPARETPGCVSVLELSLSPLWVQPLICFGSVSSEWAFIHVDGCRLLVWRTRLLAVSWASWWKPVQLVLRGANLWSVVGKLSPSAIVLPCPSLPLLLAWTVVHVCVRAVAA